MALSEIYVKLVVGFPRDPKVRRLITVCGADAGLARDLYVQMLLHCKENLTDGWMPAEEVGALAYPLPPDHGNQLAKQLAYVGLIKEESKGEAQGWQVVAFLKRNGSREDVEHLSKVRAEAGRKGGRPPGQRPAKPNGNQVAKQTVSRPNPYTETSPYGDGSVRAKGRGAATRQPPLDEDQYHAYVADRDTTCVHCHLPKNNRRHQGPS